MGKGLLIFVTMELFPFTQGGIGRVIHNILLRMPPEDRSRSLVAFVRNRGNKGENISQRRFGDLFPGARFLEITYTPEVKEEVCVWHGLSIYIADHLERLSQEEKIDYVEFQDFGGMGFTTIAEKKFRGLFSNTILAIRLHTSESVLMRVEARNSSNLFLMDIERKALRDCDRIITQVENVAKYMRQWFGFTEEEWVPRVQLHAPPVVLDTRTPVTQSCLATLNQSILFTGKLQGVKQPELFIRGVVGFMRSTPSFQGRALFCAHSFDSLYQAEIEQLIPLDLKGRFSFLPHQDIRAREAYISASMVVMASSFESFCLAAYEASLLGARVILNEANPAFKKETVWEDGKNCFKFSGSAFSLATTLKRCFEYEGRLSAVEERNVTWAWTKSSVPKENWELEGINPCVSAIIACEEATFLQELLDSLGAQVYPNLEIILVEDGYKALQGLMPLQALAKQYAGRLHVISLGTQLGRGAAWNEGIRKARGKYVLTLEGWDLLSSTFISLAVAALEREKSFDAVIPQAEFFEELQDFSPGNKISLPKISLPAENARYIGEAISSGLLQNTFGCVTGLFRREIFEKFIYREALHPYEHWGLYLELCRAGRRLLVTHEVHLYLRQRQGRRGLVTGGELEKKPYHNLLRICAAVNVVNHPYLLQLSPEKVHLSQQMTNLPRLSRRLFYALRARLRRVKYKISLHTR